jgi:long-chain acyl-CoA synthetase
MATELSDSPWRALRTQQTGRLAKRDAVLLAAARLFTRQGFQGTSLDDIARSLSVTKPTLYHYISNKDQILFECVQRGLEALRSGIADITQRGLTGRERLRAAMENYAATVTSDFGLCVIRVGEDPLAEPRKRELRALKGQIDAEFRRLIEEGMDQGWIVRGEASMAAYSVVGALSGIARWYRPENHAADSLQGAVTHCIEMLMRGVLSAPVDPLPSNELTPTPTNSRAPVVTMRREVHFQNRVLRCFAERPGTLAQMLGDAVQQRPDGQALVCDGLSLSWRELHHAASKCAGGLLQRGVLPGDRVALFLDNGPEFVIVALACAWMGAVLLPISARARGGELTGALEDSGAVAIVCTDESIAFLPPAPALPGLRHRFSTGPAPGAGPGADRSTDSRPGLQAQTHRRIAVEPLLALMQAAPLATPHAAAEEDLAVLLYTSGTTGQPKGVMLTHLNIAHSVLHYTQLMALTEDDRSAVAVPLSHVTGLVAQFYTMLSVRGCMVLMRQFKAAEFVRLAARERISHAILVPAMYNLCLLLPDLQAHDLSAWRIGAYGGAAMPTASIEGLAARLPGLKLMNAYGATETCSPAILMPPGQTAAHRASVGLPVPCADLHIADEHGREVARGEIGEIWIAGPMVTPGYWRDEGSTATEFCGGYWRSGDIGCQDEQGFVRILDRKKDVINRGGYKIFCVAVEHTMAEHPQVVESALIGVPCAVLGERVHAFVCVRQIGAASSAQALRDFCAERLADYAVPETWTIDTEPLPRNLNGKLMKLPLRQRLHSALT